MEWIARIQPLVPAWRLDKTFDYAVPESLVGRLRVGSLVRIPLGGRKVRGVIRALAREERTDETLESVIGVVLADPVAEPPLDSVLDEVALRYTTPRGRVFARVVPPRVRIKVGAPLAAPIPAVKSAIGSYRGGSELLQAISSGGAGTWCFRFALSEDRAAIISSLIEACRAGSALVAVPEVRYGDVTLGSLASHLPGAVRVDSAVGDAERARGLLALAAGHRVGLGGRATLLASTRDLRLVVVVDEHHPALKEDRAPRYDSRWLAAARAEASHAVCVLASASPSLETSWAASSGRIGLVEPERAVDKARHPLVQIAEPPPGGLARELHRAIRDTLRAGRRVGLLVPAAGFGRALWCAACRRSVRCKVCEAGITTTSGGETVVCPRCGDRGPAPDACPTCGSDELKILGAGSERVTDQIQKIFPRSNVVRMDPDVLSGGDRAGSEDADIYVTTWIGTKPAIRPEVGLVGVLDADAWIRRPDFRSAERAYQALVAMADWAGSREAGGRLLIQTREPEHHVVQAVVRASHRFFVDRESDARRELGYPPFSELVKVRAEGPETAVLLDEVRSVLAAEDRLLGPIDVPGDLSSASEVLIKTQDAGRIAQRLRVILPRVPGGNRLRVDTDPR